MCAFLSISYKDVFIRVLLFTYFTLYFVYVVCTVHGTLLYFILLKYFTIVNSNIVHSMFTMY